VLKEATPRIESRINSGQWPFTTGKSVFKWGQAKKNTNNEAQVQRQKARAMGGMLARTARPTIKLPDQKNTAKVSRR
jgi:hypothetical protein